MIRPQKKFTNRLIDQWEQNLLLKVMQRKIKSAKSTIPGVGKSHQQSTSTILNPRNTCSLEWNFSDLKRRLPLVRTSNPKVVSLSPRQLNQRDITAKVNDKKEKKFIKSSSEKLDCKIGGVIIHELEDGEEDENFGSETDVETVGLELSDDFLADEFGDTDDDLLSQLWNTCKREDALLDNAPLPKQRRVGPTSTAVFYLNTTTVPEGSKLNPVKENRPSRNLSLARKSKVREQMVSKIMKKREDGWRE